jgi:predicted nucleic acid-binding protein
MDSKVRVYLDNCVYNRPFDDLTKIKIALEAEAKRYIQRFVVEGKIELAYSFVSRFENSKSPYPHNQKSIDTFFVNATVYIYHTYGLAIRQRAEEIIKTGVKIKDAYHIACALESKCHYFITVDNRLLKYPAQDVIICNPIQFLDYLEGDQQ